MESENTQSIEEEIAAAIKLREPQFDRYPYRVEYRRQRDGTRVIIRRHNTLDWSKPRTVPSIAWLQGYQQAALDLLRLQRREAKIAAMEAKPKQYNSVQDMVDATSPELSQEFRDRKPNSERIRELTEDNADRLTEAEIRAAIDAKQEDFLMRLQRWEKTKATVVGAVMEEEPCSYCNAEPSYFKVEMLPREITWREVVEAVKAATSMTEWKVDLSVTADKIAVLLKNKTEYYSNIDEAITYLRELAEPKPDPITPEKLWAECGGTGPIPEWAREAALAEAGRRNTKGGEQ